MNIRLGFYPQEHRTVGPLGIGALRRRTSPRLWRSEEAHCCNTLRFQALQFADGTNRDVEPRAGRAGVRWADVTVTRSNLLRQVSGSGRRGRRVCAAWAARDRRAWQRRPRLFGSRPRQLWRLSPLRTFPGHHARHSRSASAKSPANRSGAEPRACALDLSKRLRTCLSAGLARTLTFASSRPRFVCPSAFSRPSPFWRRSVARFPHSWCGSRPSSPRPIRRTRPS